MVAMTVRKFVAKPIKLTGFLWTGTSIEEFKEVSKWLNPMRECRASFDHASISSRMILEVLVPDTNEWTKVPSGWFIMKEDGPEGDVFMTDKDTMHRLYEQTDPSPLVEAYKSYANPRRLVDGNFEIG